MQFARQFGIQRPVDEAVALQPREPFEAGCDDAHPQMTAPGRFRVSRMTGGIVAYFQRLRRQSGR